MINLLFKYILVVLSFFSLTYSLGQEVEDRFQSEKVSDCDGAVNIIRPGSYKLQFTGSYGHYLDLKNYPKLSEMEEVNSIWASFSAPFNGTLSLTAHNSEDIVQMIVFKSESDDICGEVYKGNAEIERLYRNEDSDSIILDQSKREGSMYSIELNEGEQALIFFNSNTKHGRSTIDFNLSFEGASYEKSKKDLIKLIDKRKDPKDRYINISLRDVESGMPVEGFLSLKDSKIGDQMYRGTDFIFSAVRRETFTISVDAPGYFYYDREESVDGESDHEVTIWLEPAFEGRKIEVKGLKFRSGSTDLVPGADSSLKRLKDFLSLNSEIKVEIQGHVHSKGKNTFAAKRMSYSRAKEVQKYLVENGIDKSRLEVKGYGNEQMIFPDAKLTAEEQANRRVEIKILPKE